MTPTLGKTVDGKPLAIDVDVLIASRALVQAQSGGGKSWLLRRMFEQLHGIVPQIIIDPEDEFFTLRERFDYVLVAPRGGDCVADVKSAGLLARKLLEFRVSAIIGIYEMKPGERIAFVKAFLESLISAPRRLWGSTLVALDEANKFAPQSSKCESLSAVADLAALGRKRGLGAVMASQRLSKFHKDVVAELGNKILGRTGLVTDRDRAADEIGIPRAERQSLQRLPPGTFFVFGPALSQDVVEVKIGPVKTTHPKAGQRAMEPAAPGAKVKAILAKLTDLPQEAEAEARSIAELQAKVRRLERDLRQVRKAAPAPVVERVEVPVPFSPITPPMVEQMAEAARSMRATAKEQAALVRACESHAKACEDIVRIVGKAMSRIDSGKLPGVTARAPSTRATAAPRPRSSRAVARPAPTGDLTGPEQRILDALAWLEAIGVAEPKLAAVAFLAKYRPGGGAFNNPRAKLRAKGLLEYGDNGTMRITEAGLAAAAVMDVPHTAEGLHEAVMAQLKGPEQRILRPLLDAYPESMSNADLAAAAGYSGGGGAYNNPRGKLRTLGLIDYPSSGQVVACDLLFPGAA